MDNDSKEIMQGSNLEETVIESFFNVINEFIPSCAERSDISKTFYPEVVKIYINKETTKAVRVSLTHEDNKVILKYDPMF